MHFDFYRTLCTMNVYECEVPQMEYKELVSRAKENFKGRCRVCPVCNGIACAGEIPGVGGIRTARSFKRNYEAWQEYGIVMKSIAGVQETDVDMKCQFLDFNLDIPVLVAPIGGVPLNLTDVTSEEEYCEAVCLGARQAGTIAFTGDSGAPGIYEAGLAQLSKTEYQMVPTIKPRANEEIIKYAKRALDGGAKAIACDIDAAVLVNMRLFGQPVETKTPEKIKELVDSLGVPFIVKGVMSAEEATMCAEAGVAAIVVSNHGGRIMDGMAATADVLPSIAQAVKGRLTIIVDGGIRTGEDIYKALALGADLVMVGRPPMIGAVGGGQEGVALVLNKMKQELRDAMMMTGVARLGEINKNSLLKY